MKHELMLMYSYQDDGIWLVCSTCKPIWEKNLGYTPSPDEVQEAVREHDDSLTRTT